MFRRADLTYCPICKRLLIYYYRGFKCECGLTGELTYIDNIMFKYNCLHCGEKYSENIPFHNYNYFLCPDCADRIKTKHIAIYHNGYVKVEMDSIKKPEMIVKMGRKLSYYCHCEKSSDPIIIPKYKPIDPPEYRKTTSVCKILAKHRTVLKDDPERLRSDFIRKLVNPKIECDE